jgi:hypothetical protein
MIHVPTTTVTRRLSCRSAWNTTATNPLVQGRNEASGTTCEERSCYDVDDDVVVDVVVVDVYVVDVDETRREYSKAIAGSIIIVIFE